MLAKTYPIYTFYLFIIISLFTIFYADTLSYMYLFNGRVNVCLCICRRRRDTVCSSHSVSRFLGTFPSSVVQSVLLDGKLIRVRDSAFSISVLLHFSCCMGTYCEHALLVYRCSLNVVLLHCIHRRSMKAVAK